LVVDRVADGDSEMVGGEAGEAVAGSHGDAAGGESLADGRSVADLQQEEVRGRRPDPHAGQGWVARTAASRSRVAASCRIRWAAWLVGWLAQAARAAQARLFMVQGCRAACSALARAGGARR
jgi:hypothetical protein